MKLKQKKNREGQRNKEVALWKKKINKPFSKTDKDVKRDTQVAKIRNKRGGITTDPCRHQEEGNTSQALQLRRNGPILWKAQISKFTYYEIDNLNSSRTIKEIE